jgi:hypothetical protein
MSRSTPSEATLKSGYRGWRFTAHAIERMHEMKLHADEVVETVLDPVLKYPSVKYPEMEIAVRGRLAVPHSPKGFIPTVLWHGKEER